MLGYGRAYGCGHIAHTAVVHLHILPYHGLPYYRIYGAGLLDEYKAVHMAAQTQPAEMALGNIKMRHKEFLAKARRRSFHHIL